MASAIVRAFWVFVMGAIVFLQGRVEGAVIYVDADATGANNGTSWANAYKYLQNGLSDARGSSDQVWVAEGTYKPDQDTAHPSGTGSRTPSFSLDLLYGRVYGGFVGNETSQNQRNWRKHKSILSGDIGTVGNNADNSYHVVTGKDAILDGFTISGGRADVYQDPGVLNDRGGGYNGSGVLVNCVFTGNWAYHGGGACGHHPTFVNCLFSGNTANFNGAAFGSYYGDATAINSVFLQEVYIHDGDATFTNCTFSGTQLKVEGEEGICYDFSYVDLYNCNLYRSNTSMVLDLNSIGDISPYHLYVTLNYCNTRNSTGNGISGDPDGTVTMGTGNISADPLFVGGYRLGANSPCLDAGDNDAVPVDTYDLDHDGNTTEKLPWDVDDHLRFFDDPAANTGHGTPPLVDIGACERNNIIYVDDDAVGANTGSSWGDAYLCLQDALAAAASGIEIWVAAGTYKPDQGGGHSAGNRDASFDLINGVGIYGGFSGIETLPEQRNWTMNESILSGDIGTVGNHSDNSYHVVFSLLNDSTAVLDGLVITRGSAAGSGLSNGGGLWTSGSPTILNCSFRQNSAVYGGGLYAASTGGTVSPSITNTAFLGNGALYGGAVYLSETKTNPAFMNCLFSGNGAASNGGALYVYNNAAASLTNCTFSGNSGNASTGYGGAIDIYLATVTAVNGVLWGNTAPNGSQVAMAGGTLTISYCDVQGGQDGINQEGSSILTWGAGNLNTNPAFVDADGADNVFGTVDDNLRLNVSACSDAGNNGAVPAGVSTDLDGLARFIDDPFALNLGAGTSPLVDMGAYERQRSGNPLIIYVNDNAAGNNNGSSWTNAYRTLQDAFTAATAGDQIWVAAGSYRPDQGVGYTLSNRAHTFLLKNNLSVYGGFVGTESNLSQRTLMSNPSILTGDLAGNDGANFTNYSDNSYNVVSSTNVSYSTVFDGFTVMAGNADGPYPSSRGGGILNNGSTYPAIRNCIFKLNLAQHAGGGVYNMSGANPVISNCLFSRNRAEDVGGALQNASAGATVINCTFSNNVAANDRGGGFRSWYSNTTFMNCIFWGNKAPQGAQIAADSSTVNIAYCDIQGGLGAVFNSGSTISWGLGNMNRDPLFFNPGADDCHLQSQLGRWNPFTSTWNMDAVTSPAIDAANPGCSLSNEFASSGNKRRNLGAFGNTPQASKTPTVFSCLGDITNDGIVAWEDFAALNSFWLQSGSELPADLNRSGAVDISDFILLASDWLSKTAWQ